MSAGATFDVVIVGAGVAGALIGNRLTRAGLKVLMLEAGPESPRGFAGYTQHLETFYAANSKGPESAWPPAVGAPQADTIALKNNDGYFVQRGPNLYGSSYTRTRGGSTLHWLGVSLRMLPEDFHMRTLHGVARDWPLDYAALEPYYEQAEWELGVSANVDDQQYHGLAFRPSYDYPMHRVPPSFSDRVLGAAVDGLEVSLGSETYALKVRSYPAARNSTPRAGYRPVGAVEMREPGAATELALGERCQGNTSCTPICPVQAKYNAGKTLARAAPSHLTLLPQAVACKILVDSQAGFVQGIEYQRYENPTATAYTREVATGRAYILAAHAVENAKLMLASGLHGPRGQIGETLMDHPALYAWGLAPRAVGAYRGPQSTAGIEELRGGAFRARHAAFRFDIGNDGWRATTGAPDTAVADAVLNRKLFGTELREELSSALPRHVRFSLAVEQLPDPANRVTIDWNRVDAFGNPRPVIDYRIDDYTLAGMAAAADVSQSIFHRAGIVDRTGSSQELWFPSVFYRGREFHYHGMGHFSGTHAMGNDPAVSVVDRDQRAWEHPNLFLVGSGSFPTMGTSNPTLTLSALALRTADRLLAEWGTGIPMERAAAGR